jgi:hypothetical protein
VRNTRTITIFCIKYIDQQKDSALYTNNVTTPTQNCTDHPPLTPHNNTFLFVNRFVGWLTNFIRQRHRAAASCAHSYSRLTFVRRIPPQIRRGLQLRQVHYNMRSTMRSYIAPYTPFCGRGSGALALTTGGWRNTRSLTDANRASLLGYETLKQPQSYTK